MRHLDLADVLRAALGDEMVVVQPGWRTRGFEMRDVRGVLCHHTAGPASGNAPSLGVVTNGRPGLSGPLSQFVLARDGTWFVVASGGANHAGSGGPAFDGVVPAGRGNEFLLGVEAENTGTGQPWPEVQLRSYIRGVAALLKDAGLPASRAIGHKEWTPRKIDPAGIDMNWFRGEVAAEMEDEMPSTDEIWAKPLNGASNQKLNFPAGTWLAGANEGAWKAAETAEAADARVAALAKEVDVLKKLILEIKAKVVGTE